MRLIDADIFDAIVNDDGTIDENATETVKNAMLAMPSVDAVPVVHGHWVEHEELLWGENTSAPYYKCSECGYDTRHDTPYCPMCGARMEEE